MLQKHLYHQKTYCYYNQEKTVNPSVVYTLIFKYQIYLCCTELNPAGVRQSYFLWDGYLSSELLAICVTVLQSQPYPSIIYVSASICLCSSLLNFYPAKTCTCLTHHALCHGHPIPQGQTHRSSESSYTKICHKVHSPSSPKGYC